MLFKFIGRYTNGHTSINASGVVFEGNEPSNVTNPEAIRRLRGNPDFEAAGPLDHDGNGEDGGSLPAEPAALTGKNKAALLEIAASEGVEVEEGATNKQIAAAIEAARAASPESDDGD